MEKIFGDVNTKEVKKIEKIADKVMALEEEMAALSDDELKAKTPLFRDRLADGETLDDILPEAFAVCREAAWRTLNMKHFRVQVIGGICLHQGRISEMKTGEGKTLVATLPTYLNALEGKGVHVVTVNDYLAKRDSEWMGQVYTFLGLTVGCVIHGISDKERKESYLADITYGTNNEFGFDYLRDNMASYKEELTQRELNYAIVDEVDSILIDEARTPLIISGRGDESTDLYQTADRFVRTLRIEEDYTTDEKDKKVSLTDEGVVKAEKYFRIENFGDPENMEINHHVLEALKAHAMMKRDIDYIVKDGEIIIVDEFTGRLMFGRRYSNGLHQAIEAKEGVLVRAESKTLATITLQNYFRMYNKLAGMTGTAKTEEEEFRDIYGMDVLEIPTNKPVIRDDRDDAIFSTQKAKYKAIVERIAEVHETGQPILVGTISIEISEFLSHLLDRRGIKHNVLNAKQHEKEAQIVAEAGRFGAVTIATNMAGRGTDIILGGKDCTEEEHNRVVELGGLCIIGTERHESRRIDNQLRGRAGRQGDPGETQFYISLEDDLMRLFGGGRMQSVMDRFGMSDEAIGAGMLSKTIENAQKKVESRNYEVRKYVLQYDNVMNKQREVIYDERRKVLFGDEVKDYVMGMMESLVSSIVGQATVGAKFPEEWDMESLNSNISRIVSKLPEIRYEPQKMGSWTPADLENEVLELMRNAYADKEAEIGEEVMREVEKMIMLRVVDNRWMDHIDAMDDLKQGVGLRALGQIDPAVAYANEGFDMFEEMISDIQEETVRFCYNVTVNTNAERKHIGRKSEARKDEYRDENAPQGAFSNAGSGAMPKAAPKAEDGGRQETFKREAPKVGRNDPCPCGSGKKYKNCCGRN